MPTDWRPRRAAGAVNHERPLGSRRGTARLPDAPGSLPADMRGQSGPCKDWIGQSIEGDPQVWRPNPEGCTIAPHSSRICRLATVLRGGTTYFQRPRTRLESWGTHDHYDDARLWSTVSCECEDG